MHCQKPVIRLTALLSSYLSDAAGAVVVGASEEPGILSTHYSDGNGELLSLEIAQSVAVMQTNGCTWRTMKYSKWR